ncbi:MAG: putative bifunctional diguanylate cyclase/phosphodiesterase [Calditrichia bacterium]
MGSLINEVIKSQKTVINILLIEKEPGDALLVREFLNEAVTPQCTVNHADTLQRAIHILESSNFDVLLVDITMLQPTTGEALASITEQAQTTPIIFLTDLEEEYDGSLIAKRSKQDYLVKQNLSATHLLRSIRFAIERNWMMEQLEKAKQIEQHLAYHDVLTGLPNRQLFQDRLDQIIKQAARADKKVSVLSIDLDEFKRINDTLGHSTGDHILKIMSQRLQSCIRKSDTVARQGGDEFIIMLNEIGEERHAVTVAKKILTSLVKPINIDEHTLYLTGSVGVSLFPSDGDSFSTLVKNAEVAMHRAKKQGKNTYELYNLSMDAEAMEKLELENKLHDAVKKGEFTLHYQPLLNLISGKIEGVEALIRWNHPTLGSISPEKFIPLAEETGLIEPLGEWVMHTACIHAKTLHNEGFEGIRFAVNLSNKQFRNDNLHKMILEVLSKTDLDPQLLGLEVTESSAMRDVEYTIDILNKLKESGIRISIDDFGTGYSSLSYLKKLPIDILKIDRSFIENVPQDNENKSITSAIIFLAHNLGMKVVAEGVENQKQLSFLRSMRCDYIQGFMFSKPIPFDELKKLLTEYRAI